MPMLLLLLKILPFGCLLGFYHFFGIVPAIQGYLISIIAQLIVLLVMKEIRTNQIFKYVLAISMSTLTLVTSNLLFFISEITIYYLISGLIICVALLQNKINIEKYSEVLMKINQHKKAFVLSAFLCLFVASVNCWVHTYYSLSTWVYFRIFGPLMFIIVLPIVLGTVFSFKYKKDIPTTD